MAQAHLGIMSAVCSSKSGHCQMREAYIAALQRAANVSADSAIAGVLHLVRAGGEACASVMQAFNSRL